MRDREDSVREEVREAWAQLRAENPDIEPDDTFAHNAMTERFHEIADSNVPVYTGDILEMAAGDIGLATDTPELGPAFGGEPTPVNIIAANIFERLYNVAGEEWRTITDEFDPDDDDE